MDANPMLGGETILRVEKLHKLYARRPAAARHRLGASVGRALSGRKPPEITDLKRYEFWALEDVSFELQRGEALGVIGLNGSGKTTLLRTLAGQILPDRGQVWIKGSSAAMIDLQAGFQPGASGRENIFLRAGALGFSRAQTLTRLEEIIDFSELGEAIDAPMATYSAGMKMRLAFSVMAMVEPDVLFIDEVLGVGDFRFRQKSLTKIREMRSKSAFVLVSHAMASVQRFCDRAIVLHKGKVAFAGKPDDAIAFYHTLEYGAEPQAEEKKKRLIPEKVDRPDMLSDVEFEWRDSGAGPNQVFEGAPMSLRVSFTVGYKPVNLIVGVPLYDMEGNTVTGFATDANGLTLTPEAGERVSVEMTAPNCILNPGRYQAAIGITDGAEFLFMDYLPDLIVKPAGKRSWGVVSIPCEWRVNAPETNEAVTT